MAVPASFFPKAARANWHVAGHRGSDGSVKRCTSCTEVLGRSCSPRQESDSRVCSWYPSPAPKNSVSHDQHLPKPERLNPNSVHLSKLPWLSIGQTLRTPSRRPRPLSVTQCPVFVEGTSGTLLMFETLVVDPSLMLRLRWLPKRRTGGTRRFWCRTSASAGGMPTYWRHRHSVI